MTTWRHANEPGDHGLGQVLDFTCVACFDAGRTNGDICTTPTPDPTSPCGRSFDKALSKGSFRCLFPGDHVVHDEARAPLEGWRYHPHVPTRCTCGHPIEEATR